MLTIRSFLVVHRSSLTFWSREVFKFWMMNSISTNLATVHCLAWKKQILKIMIVKGGYYRITKLKKPSFDCFGVFSVIQCYIIHQNRLNTSKDLASIFPCQLWQSLLPILKQKYHVLNNSKLSITSSPFKMTTPSLSVITIACKPLTLWTKIKMIRINYFYWVGMASALTEGVSRTNKKKSPMPRYMNAFDRWSILYRPCLNNGASCSNSAYGEQ